MTPEYLAGLIDGEGSIYIWRTRMVPRVAISMDSSATVLIMKINAEYGGILSKETRKRGNSVISIKWNSFSGINNLLTIVCPYLVLKQEQAKLVLWWIANYQKLNYGMERVNIINEELTLMKKNPLRLAELAIDRISGLNVIQMRGYANG